MSERYTEIDEVVAYIHRHLHDPLSLARLANEAGYSPFHFTRIFKERIGLSPQYYISSLRLQRAKDLLLRTNLHIRDIALEVGQQSLGTFTTRFTGRVGMTPSEFRQSRHEANHRLEALKRLSDWQTPDTSSPSFDRIEGDVRGEEPFDGIVLIGLFAKPIPEGLPLYGTLIPSAGPFRLAGVKPGTYYLMATSLSWNTDAMNMLIPQATLRTRSRDPVEVSAHRPVPPLQVTLYPPRLDDPPILISLPVLMNQFLRRMSQESKSAAFYRVGAE